MMEMRKLLPQTKADTAALGRLAGLTHAELEPLIPELLTWMQDANWPIYSQVAKFLQCREEIVIPHVKAILCGKDYIWIGWLLEDLISAFSPEGQAELKTTLYRFAEWQEGDEDMQKCSQLSREILDGIK